MSFRNNRVGFFAVLGTLKSLFQHHSLKASILQHLTFFIVQLSHLYLTTGQLETTSIALESPLKGFKPTNFKLYFLLCLAVPSQGSGLESSPHSIFWLLTILCLSYVVCLPPISQTCECKKLGLLELLLCLLLWAYVPAHHIRKTIQKHWALPEREDV